MVAKVHFLIILSLKSTFDIYYSIWKIIIWVDDTMSSLQMSLFANKILKLLIQKSIIFYYMNLKYPCNLWKPLKILLRLQNMMEDENVVIKQAWHDEIKWIVCLFKIV